MLVSCNLHPLKIGANVYFCYIFIYLSSLNKKQKKDMVIDLCWRVPNYQLPQGVRMKSVVTSNYSNYDSIQLSLTGVFLWSRLGGELQWSPPPPLFLIKKNKDKKLTLKRKWKVKRNKWEWKRRRKHNQQCWSITINWRGKRDKIDHNQDPNLKTVCSSLNPKPNWMQPCSSKTRPNPMLCSSWKPIPNPTQPPCAPP